MMIKPLLLAAALMVSLTASAQKIRVVPLPPSQNPTGTLPIAGGVWAGDTFYVSGWLDGERKSHPDTQTQTMAILKDVQAFLATQKLTMANVVMMRVYLGPDPAKDGKADTAGMTAAYTQFFGTKDQPHTTARTTLQAALPSAASGALVEIDFVAVK